MVPLNRFLIAGLLAAGSPAVAQKVENRVVDGWSETTFDTSCNASRIDRTPTLSLEVKKKDGQTALQLFGLRMPSLKEDPTGSLGMYEAAVAVSLNGKQIFTVNLLKTTGFLEIKNIGFERMAALAAAGPMVFDLTGNGGQHEAISYESPGLAPAIAFLKKCIAK